MSPGTGQHRPWRPGGPPCAPGAGSGPGSARAPGPPAPGHRLGREQRTPGRGAEPGRPCGRGTARPGAGRGFPGPTRKSNHGVNRGSPEHALKVRLSLFILPNENCGVSESKRQLFMTINKCRGDRLRPCGLGAGPSCGGGGPWAGPSCGGAGPLLAGPPARVRPLPRPTRNLTACRREAGGGRGRCACCCPGSFPRLGGRVRLPGRRAPR